MGDILKDLLNGSGPLVIIIFGFLLAYFFWDVIKKLSKVEGIEETSKERIEKVASHLHDLRNLLQKETVHREVNDKCIEKLQKEVRELHHELIRWRSERGQNDN